MVLFEVATAFPIVYWNERAFQTVLINLSDQQLITSLSLVIALIYKLRQSGDPASGNYVSVFSYNLAMNMLLISLISHMTALLVSSDRITSDRNSSSLFHASCLVVVRVLTTCTF